MGERQTSEPSKLATRFDSCRSLHCVPKRGTAITVARPEVALIALDAVTPTLRTTRLLLQPYVPEDETGFVSLLQDARVSQWMGDGPAAEESYRASFRRLFSRVYSEDLFDVWAVREDGKLIGHAEIKPTDTVAGHEIIFALAPSSWGSGLGTELASAIVAHGFDTRKLTEVFATVATQNTASLAVLDKIGFTHVRDIDDGATRVLSCSVNIRRLA